MGAKNSIDLKSDPRSIIGSRVFDAPRDLVFAAFTDPKHLARGGGRTASRTTTHSFDFRPGGVWRFVMHGPDGRDYQNRVTYDEIVPPERLVYRHGGGDDVEPVQFTQTADLRGSRQRPDAPHLARHVPDRRKSARASIKKYGADKGLAQTMARLADYVAAMGTKA